MKQHTFSILFGTAFSIFAIPFSSLYTSFILGAAGALGAWLITTLCKWLFGKFKKRFS